MLMNSRSPSSLGRMGSILSAALIFRPFQFHPVQFALDIRQCSRIVIDAVREIRPPFSPEGAISELSAFFKSYRVSRITLDRWGVDFPAEQFRKHGISCDTSEKTKSDIYLEFLPLLNSGRVEILDDSRLIKQLLSLERRIARGGRTSVDRPAGGSHHDDKINSAAGSAVLAATKQPMTIPQSAIEAMRRPSRTQMKCFFEKGY